MPFDKYGNELNEFGVKKKNLLPNPLHNPPLPKPPPSPKLPPGWAAWKMSNGMCKVVNDKGAQFQMPLEHVMAWQPEPDTIQGYGQTYQTYSSTEYFYVSDLVKETEKKEHPLNFISGPPPETSSVKLSDLYKDNIVTSGKSMLHAHMSINHPSPPAIDSLTGLIESGHIKPEAVQAPKPSKWETEEATVSDHEDFAQVLEFLADRVRSAKPGSLAIEQVLTNFTEEDGPLVGKPAVHNMVQSIWARREVSVRIKFDS